MPVAFGLLVAALSKQENNGAGSFVSFSYYVSFMPRGIYSVAAAVNILQNYFCINCIRLSSVCLGNCLLESLLLRLHLFRIYILYCVLFHLCAPCVWVSLFLLFLVQLVCLFTICYYDIRVVKYVIFPLRLQDRLEIMWLAYYKSLFMLSRKI